MTMNRKFITTCTLTFKAFDFDVTMSEGKSTLWNFIAYNPNNQKRYAVFCTPAVSKVKGLIKVALKKLPADHRLVVVAQTNTDQELKEANELNYCLVSLNTLETYGQEMLEVREVEVSSQSRNSASDETTVHDHLEEVNESSDFIDRVIHKDKLF
jgi:hypothetical protein